MSSEAICIIQARTGSSRFPNKAFADLHGRPVIARVIERAQQIRGVRFVVLAVPFADIAAFQGLGCPVYGFAGLPEDDVLGRFVHVLERYPNTTTVLRVTGDCPLLNPRLAEKVLAIYHADPMVEYASNVAPGYVDGEDVEVFSASVLKWAGREARDPYDREHVGPWIKRHAKKATLLPDEDRGFLKTSIDVPDDLERVRAMVTT